ncbi:hypothetical protein HD554DRAFT_1319964 [Boletus coccyginus]|nr:hypothetical protein HD554DRAFT_1319964 [Boletus coccyginus]
MVGTSGDHASLSSFGHLGSTCISSHWDPQLGWLFSAERHPQSRRLCSRQFMHHHFPPPVLTDPLQEISFTNYTGAARNYLKRLVTLVGVKFTPSTSQSNKVLVVDFQSPHTRALSWSIPVVNHACTLTVGLRRLHRVSPGVDFGKILMT